MTATQAPTGLPTAKRAPRAGVNKLWIHGDAGIGKSTTAIEMYPDAYAMDVEGSMSALEGFIEAEDWTWEKFIKRTAELEAMPAADRFEAAIVDTVDVLAKLCAEYTLRGLVGSGNVERFLHASDFEYGKGWSAIENEFSLRVAKLCTVVPNVIFISHSDDGKIKERSGAERTVKRPDLAPKGVRNWLEGFVDHIAYAEIDADGNRVLRTQPSADYISKTRVPRGAKAPADPMAMRGPVLRKALEKLGTGS
jgi:hypothetical protein